MQPINMIRIYYWGQKLKNKWHVLKAGMITIKKHWIDLSSLKHAFLQDVFKMTVIAGVLVINHYHMNGLHLFWNALYFEANILSNYTYS